MKKLLVIFLLLFSFVNAIGQKHAPVTTSCFIFMEVLSRHDKGILLYYGDGEIERIKVDNPEKSPKGMYLQAIAQISDTLYKLGWQLITVSTDKGKNGRRVVPRYFTFERIDCPAE